MTTEHSDLERRIRQRAFRIWVEEGHPFGKEREHWTRAKAEVLAGEPRFTESRRLDGAAIPPATRAGSAMRE